MKELGIFLPDGSFRSKSQIMQAQGQPVFETPLPKSGDFAYWTQRYNVKVLKNPVGTSYEVSYSKLYHS